MGIQENILSIDLESWVYPEIPKYRLMSSEEKKRLDNGYLKRSIVYLLEILKKTNNSATFFVVADQYNWDKEIIKLIKKNGHEIGYHTHTHIYLKNENDLNNQINLSTNFIEEIKPKDSDLQCSVINPLLIKLLRNLILNIHQIIIHVKKTTKKEMS